MIHWRSGRVEGVRRRWPGAAEYIVRLEDGTALTGLAYTDTVGELAPDERVLLNASAQLRGLGTGGFALIVARVDLLPADPPAAPGHIVKARYTPLQQMVLAVDEQESPDHELMAQAASIDGMPVVVADLHSAVPAIIAGIRADRPDAKIAYLMTDDAALPMAFSRAVAGLRAASWLAGTITVGQAYGGDLEAVSIHSGLLAARHLLGADVAIVAQGPGNAGTGTPWGYSGIAVVDALHASAALGGRQVASLRVSGADPRDRHRGVSHHSLTAYTQALFVPAELPVPKDLPSGLSGVVQAQLDRALASARSTLTVCQVSIEGLIEALAGSPVPLSTMGRGLDDDPAAFLAAAAAGRHAISSVA